MPKRKLQTLLPFAKKPKTSMKTEVDGDTSSVSETEYHEKIQIKRVKKSKDTNKFDAPLPHLLKYECIEGGPPVLPFTGSKFVGSHVSASGGVWNAFANAEADNASSFALFLRNQRSWNAKPLDETTIKKWSEAKKKFPSHLILPHGSYLMNLGSPRPNVLQKSRDVLVEELTRCHHLGIPQFNFHPGSTLGQVSREECCRTIAESINMAHKKTEGVICVLENMSKQGFTIGGDFHELRHIIEHVEDKTRIGVCLDTCHSHAAGFDLSTEEGFDNFISEFSKIIGWKFLRGLHINDSKGKCGDRKDRHENIGKGTIGVEGFKRIMNCSHFSDMPLILETPYKADGTYEREIKLLKGLILSETGNAKSKLK